MTADPAALLPCPFCGHPEPAVGEYGTEHVPWNVYCMGDDCMAEVYETTYERAVASWNRRAPARSEGEGER